MKVSTRTTYGLRAMIFLGKNWNKETVSLRLIAKKEELSLGYLERIFRFLKKANLVISEKGSSGGYKLAKSPNNINIFEVIKVLEGDMNLFHCIDDQGRVNCSIKCDCKALNVLTKVQKAVRTTLEKIKLSDLI